jgi:serine protease Do
MTGWVAATTTAVMIGAAAAAPGTYGQSIEWAQSRDSEPAFAAPELEQAFRILKGPGGQIGVTIRDLTQEDLKGKAGSTGVMIEQVETDSPAAKAGFRAGDIVVEFDGERVRSTRQFTRLVQETATGRPVATAVLRDGQRVTLNVEPREGGSFRMVDGLGNYSFSLPKAVPPPAKLAPRVETLFGTGRLGITVSDLSSQLAGYFGTKDGVLVTSVNDNSTANKIGVRAGDVITGIDSGTVTTGADLRRRLQRLEEGDEFTLTIVRDKKTMSLKGKLEPSPTRIGSGRVIL